MVEQKRSCDSEVQILHSPAPLFIILISVTCLTFWLYGVWKIHLRNFSQESSHFFFTLKSSLHMISISHRQQPRQRSPCFRLSTLPTAVDFILRLLPFLAFFSFSWRQNVTGPLKPSELCSSKKSTMHVVLEIPHSPSTHVFQPAPSHLSSTPPFSWRTFIRRH